MEDESFCKSITPACVGQFGKLNYLVNNAFSFIAKGLDATVKEWERMMRVGPIAYSLLAASVLEPMKAQGGGAIVNMSSISAFIGSAEPLDLQCSKGRRPQPDALHGLRYGEIWHPGEQRESCLDLDA